MNLIEIAQQLKDNSENIILIYAFNSTGKTRLSVAYKNLTKSANNGNHSGTYYNAFSEDLFVWDNDEINDNENIKLNLVQSSLNQFHSLITVDLLEEKLAPYRPNYSFSFNNYDNLEDGIESITFTTKNNQQIKISRGEERIFVWCFFLALFDIDGWVNKQDEHFFIDDPVSSLDDHNIFVTANSIIDIIETSNIKKRIIITTHHIGLFSILFDRLKKGDKSSKYKNLTKIFILKNQNEEIVLKAHDKDVFLFHLHLIQTLDLAIKNQLYAYHFVLLRQLLENISSFLGKGGIKFALTQIGISDSENSTNIINSLSHKDAFRIQFNEMSLQEEVLFKDIFEKIILKYNFKF